MSLRRVGFRCATPTGGGCYSFSLVHGHMETKRGVKLEWSLDPGDLAQMRELAAERKIKPRKPRAPGRPRKPRKEAPSKQAELFRD